MTDTVEQLRSADVEDPSYMLRMEAAAEIGYWREYAAVAWDKCEERRLENRAQAVQLAEQATVIVAMRDRMTRLQDWANNPGVYGAYKSVVHRNMDNAIADLLALTPDALAGMVLVSREPTDPMRKAGGTEIFREAASIVYRAMIEGADNSGENEVRREVTRAEFLAARPSRSHDEEIHNSWGAVCIWRQDGRVFEEEQLDIGGCRWFITGS